MIGLGDVDAFSGFRITPRPSRPGLHEKYSETPHFHSITSGQCSRDLVENGIDDLFGILDVQVGILLGDARNQFWFDHEPLSPTKKLQWRAIVVKAPTVTMDRPPRVADLHLVTTKTRSVRDAVCLFSGSPCYYRGVKGWVDLLLAVIAAAATALLLALIARDDIGMPPAMVREDALVAAGIMVALVAGSSWRKPKRKVWAAGRRFGTGEVQLASDIDRPKRLVTLRRDGDDFVVTFYPEDAIVFRHVEPISLRKVCAALRWKIISDGSGADDTTLSAL
jgi:hypothetical protein